MAPAHEVDLMNMLRTSHAIDDRPTALRYPRGSLGVEKLNEPGLGLTELPEKGEVLEVGKGLIVRPPAAARPPTRSRATRASRRTRRACEEAHAQVALLTLGTRCEPRAAGGARSRTRATTSA